MKHLIYSAPLFMHQSNMLEHAIRYMNNHVAECLLITDDNNLLVGMLTHADIMHALNEYGVEYGTAALKNIRTTPFECAMYDTYVKDIQRIHAEIRLKHFPILHKNKPPHANQVIGILSLVDLGAEFLERYNGVDR